MLLALTFSCNRKCTPTASPAQATDTTGDSTEALSPDTAAAVEPATAIPKSADEYFNDFIYSFTTDKAYQLNRIVFPLPCVKDGKVSLLEKSQWHFSRLHMKHPVYTLFFDKRASLNLEKSKDITEVKMEYFYMDREKMRTYFFNKSDDEWKMTRIEDKPLHQYKDYEFIEFYQQFATDSLFQIDHIKPTLSIRMENPEDEFEDIDGVLDAEQWPAFCPELPSDIFTNIDYGQSRRMGKRRIVVLEGSSNGYMSLLFFIKEDGEWMLERFEN